MQQLVNILQSLHGVIQSPNKVIDMTSDESVTPDYIGEAFLSANENQNMLEHYYKLICFRFAISCSSKSRSHRLTSASSSESGRCVGHALDIVCHTLTDFLGFICIFSPILVVDEH